MTKETKFNSNYDGPRLRRPCKKCGKMFTPSGKYCRYCPECNPFKINVSLPETKQHKEQIRNHKLKGYLTQLDNPTIEENE